MRSFGLMLFLSAGTLALLASAQEPAPKKDNKQAEKKDAPAGEQGENDAQRIKEIISRLDENYGKATDRLEKKDPGKDTREVQEQIIKDLDELIKQKQKNQGGGGSSQSCPNPSGGSSGESSQTGGSSGQANQQSGKGSQGGQKNNPSALNDQKQKNQGGAGGKDQQQKKEEGLANKGGGKDDKDKKDQQANAGGKDKGGKEGKDGGGDGAKKDDPRKDKNTIADLYKDIWGHLPARDRTKMDVYSRERFMPRYEDLLRQYYRTIAEQGKRNEGE